MQKKNLKSLENDPQNLSTFELRVSSWQGTGVTPKAFFKQVPPKHPKSTPKAPPKAPPKHPQSSSKAPQEH